MASHRTSHGIVPGNSRHRTSGATASRSRLVLALAAVGFSASLSAADLVEVAPGPEGGGGIDAIVGARLLYRLVATALATRR